LGSAIPKEGGAYEYAFELISPFAGFLVGSLWLFAQIVAGAAISLGFGSYFVAIFPVFSLKTVAVVAAIALTGLNLIGIKQSTAVNNILVIKDCNPLFIYWIWDFSNSSAEFRSV
jgi:amino acid transporter